MRDNLEKLRQWVVVVGFTVAASGFWGMVAAGFARYFFSLSEELALLTIGVPVAHSAWESTCCVSSTAVSVERSVAIEGGGVLKTVIVYPGSARFAGAASFVWASPAVGGTHRFILFLAQSDSLPDHDVAQCEVASFGFCEIDLGKGREIDVDSLNDPNMAAFRRHYEGAFTEGSSLVWYP